MRGLDFRARKFGMALVINASFSCPREKSQGMNRVGRFTDKCERIKLGEQPDVDPKLSMAVWSKLLEIRDKGRKKCEKVTVSQTRDVTQNKRELKELAKTEELMNKLVKSQTQ